MSENKHPGRGRNARGYYIALILCASVIGITGYVYHQNQPREEEVVLQHETVIPAGTMTVQEDIPVIATEPRKESVPAQPTRPAPEETQPAVQKTLKVQMPVSGEEIFGYAMQTLSYNATTRDWRVHNGVDFAAEEGTPVLAAADGTVTAAGKEDALGYRVVIRHEGGYATEYASLTEDLAVSPGDTVQAGQVIGYAGTTALVETAMGSHLHFGVTCRDQPMDPAQFLALGE